MRFGAPWLVFVTSVGELFRIGILAVALVLNIALSALVDPTAPPDNDDASRQSPSVFVLRAVVSVMVALVAIVIPAVYLLRRSRRRETNSSIPQ